MQKNILFILGIFLIGIAPVFITALFQKKNNYFSKAKNKNNFVYLITLCNLCVFFLLDKNSDILLGTFIGSSLFQLLAVGGVNQLFYKEKEKMDGRGQYLVFCTILLLFLSADYLFTGNIANNMLSRVDGGLMFFLFILYFFICIRKDLQIHFPKLVYFLYLICLESVILPGSYILSQSIPKIGASFRLSQYLTGMTIVSWCVNISSMLLTREKNQEVNYLEKIMEGTVIAITFLLGGIICILPLFVSTYVVYDLIIFGVISIILQFINKIDNRLAVSSMATVYIVFVIYVFVR